MRSRSRFHRNAGASAFTSCGLPGSAAYSSSKAAQRVFGESLRVELAAEGVEVSVICPGFIKTPMTEKNAFYMPFLMDTDKAVRIITRKLARNKARIAFPWPMYVGTLLGAALPPALTEPVMRRFRRPD